MDEGYRKKPFLISLFSILYLINPIYNLLLVLLNKGTFSQNWQSLLYLLSQGNVIIWLNVFLWISAIPLAVGLFFVKRWAWYYFLFHSTSMILISLFNANASFQPSRSTLVNLLILIPIGYFLRKEIRIPYFNPRVRWWQQAKRLKHSVHLSIHGHELKTYDLSDTGAFIATDQHEHFEPKKQYPATLIYGDQTVEMNAVVHWINPKDGEYPQGIGVAFTNLSSGTKRKIRRYINALGKSGTAWSRGKD